jgi:hypothetical protein
MIGSKLSEERWLILNQDLLISYNNLVDRLNQGELTVRYPIVLLQGPILQEYRVMDL